MVIFNIFYPTSTLTATCNIVIFSSIKTKINDDDELFLWYGWPTKGEKPYSSRDHYQRSLPSRISDTLRAGFEPAQNLSSGLVEWSCTVVITTTPRHHVAVKLFSTIKNLLCDILVYKVGKSKVETKFTFLRFCFLKFIHCINYWFIVLY